MRHITKVRCVTCTVRSYDENIVILSEGKDAPLSYQLPQSAFGQKMKTGDCVQIDTYTKVIK
jgi:hypothetical protein